MLNHLMREEVHAVIKSLQDLYVQEHTGHGDLNITLVREADANEGRTEEVRGFVVSLDAETVTLGVGAPNISHRQVSLSDVVSITIER